MDYFLLCRAVIMSSEKTQVDGCHLTHLPTGIQRPSQNIKPNSILETDKKDTPSHQV